jgi:hypothetical protein
MTDEWPKTWNEITPDQNGSGMMMSARYSWTDLGPLRLYDGTAYINARGGVETDKNPDEWLPLGVYLDRRS